MALTAKQKRLQARLAQIKGQTSHQLPNLTDPASKAWANLAEEAAGLGLGLGDDQRG